MSELNISEMMETGAHFGHQTKRWNPKMRPYIYAARSGVHIIDLQKTKALAERAIEFVTDAVASGKSVLFVGTKPQARDIIKDQAIRAQMHYVNNRWMGGTLTNFTTIKKSIDRLIDFTTKREKNDFEGYTKKELLDIDRMIIKLEASLGGIKKLTGKPGIVFIVDPKHEKIAVQEANKLGVPIVAIVDSNCDPDPIDYLIPANDDAISSIQYFTIRIAEACLAGLEKREQMARMDQESEGQRAKGKPTPRRKVNRSEDMAKKPQKGKGAYVARDAKPEFEGDAAGGFSAKVEVKEEPKVEIKIDDGSEESDSTEAKAG